VNLYKDIFDVSINSGIDCLLFKADNISLNYSQFIGALTLWGIISIFIWEKYIKTWLDSKNKLNKRFKRKEVIKSDTILIIVGCILTFTFYTLI